MAGKWLVGTCMAVLCAVPAFGEEGKNASAVMVSMIVDQHATKPTPLDSARQAKVKVREKLEYYDIDGSSPAELRAQMKHNGTKWNDGKVYAALTTWDIRYHYDIAAVDGRYVLTGVKTNVDVVIHMPRLSPLAKTPDPLLGSWNTYQKNLRTHEDGHRDIAVAIGEELYQGLSSLGSAPSRQELERQAQELANEEFRKLKQAQLSYDEETHHGKMQGAILADPALAGGAPAKTATSEDSDES